MYGKCYGPMGLLGLLYKGPSEYVAPKNKT